MGETDMGSNAGAEPGTTTDEATTTVEYADQRRAEAREHFSTPSWMNPGAPDHVPRVVPQVPAQTQPVHDQLHAYAPTPVSDAVPDSAHWVEHRRPRLIVGILLTLSLLGAVGLLVVSIISQAPAAIVGLVACAFLAVLFRATLMSKGVTSTDLKGPILKVRTGGDLAIFNLADPDHIVQVIGEPGSSGWKVVLEAPSGEVVELDASHVDAHEMHPIATYYNAVAQRARDERQHRFNL